MVPFFYASLAALQDMMSSGSLEVQLLMIEFN
jgi:hypothetical protein